MQSKNFIVSMAAVFASALSLNAAMITAFSDQETMAGASVRSYHSPGSSAWVVAPPASAWIGLNLSENTTPQNPGYYSLNITLDLTGFDLAQTGLGGRWASQDAGQLWLNGQDTGLRVGLESGAAASPFLVTAGFAQGLNLLEFRVLNRSQYPLTPSGLLVSDLQLIEDINPNPPPAVPDSSTYLVGLFLAVVMGMEMVRRTTLRTAVA